MGERLMGAHRAPNDAVTAPQFDEQVVRTRAAELAAVEADAAVLRAKVHSEVFAVLTPERHRRRRPGFKAQREWRAQQFRERARERVKEASAAPGHAARAVVVCWRRPHADGLNLRDRLLNPAGVIRPLPPP